MSLDDLLFVPQERKRWSYLAERKVNIARTPIRYESGSQHIL